MAVPAGGVHAGAAVDPAVFALRPDHRALLVAVDGLEPGPRDAVGEALLVRAEAATRERLAAGPVEEIPHVAAWREAYRAFGAEPQRTRNSAEALLTRLGPEVRVARRQLSRART